jgi:hypothetical protein
MRYLSTPISQLTAGVILAFSHMAFANDHHEHNHDAHVHGYAQLTLAAERNTLLINIKVPAQSLVGFEHRAESVHEIAQVNQLKATLTQPDHIMTIENSGCALIENNLDLEALLPIQHEHSSHGAETEHSEVVITYKFHCESLMGKSSAKLHIFELYPEIETIKALWITESQQGADNLTSEKNILTWG